MKNLILIFFGILLISCNNGVDSSQTSSQDKIAPPKEVIYSEKCLIFFSPDSLEIVSLEKEKSQEELNSIDYYKTMAIDFLSDKETPYHFKDARYYNFVKTSGEKVVVDKKEHQNWGIILFDPAKAPKVIFLNSLELKYNDYFN